MKPVTVSVLGYGLGGRVFHVPLLYSSAQFQLLSVTGSSFRGDMERYPGVGLSTPEEVFSCSDVELVVITTPNSTHGPLARQALEAGKHVVVDKPFCLSTSEALDLTALAREKGLLLTVFQNRRWDGDFLTAAGIMREGRLGNVVHLESSFPRYRLKIRETWKEEEEQGGGILWDLGPHLLDQAVHLFGSPQNWWIDCRYTRPGAKNADDFEIFLDYGPTRRVILKAAMVRPWPGPRFEIHGTLGSYVKFGLEPQEEALKSGYFPGALWGREAPENSGILYIRDEKGGILPERIPSCQGDYGEFYRKVAESVRQGSPAPVDPGENAGIIAILEDLSKTLLAGSPRQI